MKKTIMFCAFAILIFFCTSCQKDIEVAYNDNSDLQATWTATKTEDVVKTITVSCAGDCTLSSDASFSGGTFEDILKAEEYDYSHFFKNVKSIFEDDDITIVNLEGALSKNGSRMDKQFVFRGDPETVNILVDGDVEAVTLANNHSSDYGKISLEDTKKTLKESGIEYAYNTEIATINTKGISVAVIGLYQLDESADEIIDSVMKKAEHADLKIVQIHWGVEKATTPLDSQVDLAYRAIDLGADLVIGHHPHVLQGIEKYKGKYICYSLGNFCFGGNQNPSDKDSMIFRQTFSFREGRVANTDDKEIIPFSISSTTSSNNYQPTPLGGDERDRVMNKIITRSKSLGDGNIDLIFD